MRLRGHEDDWEIERNRRIARVQGAGNPFVEPELGVDRLSEQSVADDGLSARQSP